MRLQQLTPLRVGDATFFIRMSWGRYKAIANEQSALPEGDPNASVAFMERTLREVVFSVTGLEDADGAPVKWTPELVDELPPSVVKQLAEGVFGIGEAENPTAAATTGEPPGS